MAARPRTLSDQIRRAFAESGRGVRETAREIGVGPSGLSRFATGKAGLGLDALDRLAALLRLTVITEPTPPPMAASKRRKAT